MKRRSSVALGLAAVAIIAATPLAASWLGGDDPGMAFVAEEPRGPVESGYRVSRVVDGDTIQVNRNGQRTRVRLLGIDTPETVHPSKPVECFGPEASAFALEQLEGKTVLLELDPGQPREDRYGRTLAYVWVDGVMFNADALLKGFARRYVPQGTALSWESTFIEYEGRAQSANTGLWQACE